MHPPSPLQGTGMKLGTPLEVEVVPGRQKEEYDDLDELLVRYADPLAENVRRLVKHR